MINISTEQYYQCTVVQVINLIVTQFCVHPAVSYLSAPHLLLSYIFCLYIFCVGKTKFPKCILLYEYIDITFYNNHNDLSTERPLFPSLNAHLSISHSVSTKKKHNKFSQRLYCRRCRITYISNRVLKLQNYIHLRQYSR